MARIITLGFDDPSEFLLGTPSVEYGGWVKAASVMYQWAGGLESLGVIAMNGNNVYWQYALPYNVAELYFVGSFFTNSLTNAYQIVSFDTRTDYGFSNTLNIIWNTNGSISLRRTNTVLATSAAGLVNLNTRHTIECLVKPLNTNGTFVCKIDGVDAASYTGDTTDNAESCDGVRIYNITANTAAGISCWWDDIAINDTSGSYNNSWIGRMRLFPLYTRGAGNVTGLSRGGYDLGANFAQVRDPDPIGNTFVQGTSGTYDLYTIDTIDLATGTVINNIIVQSGGKSTSGAGLINHVLKVGATESDGEVQICPTAHTIRQHAWAINPNTGVPWTESDLASTQIGIKMRS